MSASPPRLQRKVLIKLALLAVGLGVVAVLALRGYDWRAIVQDFLQRVRDAGPLAFFGAMAVLPAFGFPLAPFTLSAGPAFVPAYGMATVIVATCVAVAVNILLTYIMARWLLRPVLAAIVTRLGYRLPEVGPNNYWDLAILLRVTPGPPFFVQSYLLGLARVPLRIYLVASCFVAWAFAIPLVIFGDAVLHGEGRKVLFGLSLMAMMAVGVQLVRKHFARKKAAASAVATAVDP